jgi:DNA-binding response OmpR family regulator
MSQPKLVLVMDDSALVLETVRAVLEQGGYAVATAENLEQLETECARAKPDLFVLDVQMPEIFGDDVGQVLREVRKMNVPILLFSSLEESDLARRAREAALDGYVTKRAGMGALLQRVVSLIGEGVAERAP